jgi:SET domain-containing protein
MLLIPTYLADSPIHGIGLFTHGPIGAGAVIWRFHPRVDWRVSIDELQRFPPRFRDCLQTYCYLETSGILVFCSDNARFMNHAEEPNCDDAGNELILALRDIRPGEELTCDYRQVRLVMDTSFVRRDAAHE